MQPARRPASPGPKGDINVTPLVDVVLVLLIIFMVITPMLQRGVDVSLPVTENPKKKPEVKEQITLSVTDDGRIFWEQTQLTDAELAQRIAETFRNSPTMPIMVKGDSRTRYASVRRVMKIINKGGFESVGILTKEREGH